jgi:REP element-mobilizing transposase RayT
MNIYKTIFLPGRHYHVFNHAISQELLFKDTDNYFYFTKRMKDHLSKYVEFKAYCLMPNHFHLLIRVKKFSSDEVEVHKTVLQAFSNFQNGYAKAINKRHGRKGRLFQSTVSRVSLFEEEDIRRCAEYIRQNPVEHGFCTTPKRWPHVWLAEAYFNAA